MPHYANGREAKISDLVIGKGYNRAHPIVGVLVGITPDQKCCNVQVAYVRPRETFGHPNAQAFPLVDIEYGQADHFLHADDLADDAFKLAAKPVAEPSAPHVS